MDLVVSAPRVIAADGVLEPGAVEFAGGRIARVRAGRPAHPPASRHVAFATGTLIPGLVDLQVNGFAGTDVADADAEALRAMAATLARAGTTAFLPTLVSAPIARLQEQLRRVSANLPAAPAARALGIHLEGPFLSAARPGAHDPAVLRDPQPDLVDTLLTAAGGALALVTLAPERRGALAAIGRLAESGAVVAVGHSDATEREARAAFDAGARMVTHLYNAQRGLHHREPGVVGAALDDARVTCGLIADGHHVAPAACRIAFAAAPDRIALVSDAVAAAGMPPGGYVLGSAPIVLRAGGPVQRADGTLAGSAISLADGVAHAVGAGVDLARAVHAASAVPANLLGRGDLGRLAAGALADAVWLDDALAPRATWIGGALVHGEPSARAACDDPLEPLDPLDPTTAEGRAASPDGRAKEIA